MGQLKNSHQTVVRQKLWFSVQIETQLTANCLLAGLCWITFSRINKKLSGMSFGDKLTGRATEMIRLYPDPGTQQICQHHFFYVR
jgi:hypothetical protein